MAILNKKLYTETENFEIATTKEELGSSESVAVEIDGIKAYIGLDNDLSLSKLKIEKDKKYAVKKKCIPPVVPGSQNYLTPGSYTFTAPYTTKYTIEVAGAGGGGGGGVYFKNIFGGTTDMASGGSGGRGALVTATLNLVQGTAYSVVVGGGGSGGGVKQVKQGNAGRGGTGGTGGTSSFNTTSARGGTGGIGGYCDTGDDDFPKSNGSAGTSYGNGGTGGAGGSPRANGSTGKAGWVKISWS